VNDSDIAFFAELECIVRDRLEARQEDSYTARLAASGTRRIAQKVGEEAVEVALAATAGDRQEIIDEAADLVYHLIVLLNERGLGLADIAAQLERRHAPD
jgi:phosphoribosyl-ATP pyrophosphohydrolase/phosphoribosyl-AMP cyclohydrolase